MYFEGFAPPNLQDPRMQRARQKILTQDPSHRAIMSTAAAESEFAGSDAMRQLKLAQIGADLEARRNQMTLQQQNANAQMNFDKKAYDFNKKQNMIGTLLAGAGMVPKAYLGYKAYDESGKSAKSALDLAKEIDALTGKIKIGGK